MTSTSKTLTLAAARAVWAHKQLSGTSLNDVPGGWSRSLGGIDPYLAMRARAPGLARGDLDAGLDQQALYVVPGVRGCIWLVPRADVSLALAVADDQYRKRTVREMTKLGVSQAELDDLGAAVLEHLGTHGPQPPDALREALDVRSLGAAGKKVGHNTTLPAALRYLEGEGRLRRRQQGGRVDSNRYVWGLPETNLLEVGEAPGDAAARAEGLARRFWSWAGPATVDEFVEWSTLGKRVAKAAVAALGLVPVAIEGLSGDYLAHADDAFDRSDDDEVYLVPAQDNLITLHGSPAALTAPQHHDRELMAMGGRTIPLHKARWVHQRPMFHGGEWIGLWAYDIDTAEVVFGGFGPLSPEVRERAEARAAETAAFIADQLGGNSKQNAIDSESFRRKRAAAVRAL